MYHLGDLSSPGWSQISCCQFCLVSCQPILNLVAAVHFQQLEGGKIVKYHYQYSRGVFVLHISLFEMRQYEYRMACLQILMGLV